MSPPFHLTQLAHDWMRDRLQPGDVAIDATAGTGRDTLFLAQTVGPAGRVYAFDVQPPALAATRQLLESHGMLPRTALFQAGHEEMLRHLPPLAGQVRAILFNLGYLPGGDKSLVTRTSTTLAALKDSLTLLAPGGLLTVVCYPGHPGGSEESEAVIAFCRTLNPGRFRSLSCQLLNAGQTSPFLLALEPRAIPGAPAPQLTEDL